MRQWDKLPRSSSSSITLESLVTIFSTPALIIESQAQLKEQTGGYGVDIILNSLNGDLLDAS